MTCDWCSRRSSPCLPPSAYPSLFLQVQESAAALGLSFEVDPFPEYTTEENSEADPAAGLFGLTALRAQAGQGGAENGGGGVNVNVCVSGGGSEERSVGVQGRRVGEDEALQQLLWALQHLAQIHQQQQAQAQKPQGTCAHALFPWLLVNLLVMQLENLLVIQLVNKKKATKPV